MIIYFTKLLRWFPLILFFNGMTMAFCQEDLTVYGQPSVALNYKVSKTYSHNFSVQNRNYFYRPEAWQLEVRHLDLSHFSSLKIQSNQSIALGVLYRFREIFDNRANELRFTQQYNITSKPHIVRYGHRFRTEQRITSNSTIFRFRYRFSIDFPLQGEKLDVGEPYLVGNIESLLSAAKDKQPQHDVRFTMNIGWKLTDHMKLQIGSEYRSEDVAQNLQHVVFFLTNLNVSL